VKDAAGSLLDHLMDINNPSEPRMPRLEDLKLLELMGVISSLCTICSVRIRHSAGEHRTRRSLANRSLGGMLFGAEFWGRYKKRPLGTAMPHAS
jgi:hypothetical protein